VAAAAKASSSPVQEIRPSRPSAARLDRRRVDRGAGRVQLRARLHLREPAVPEAADPPVSRGRLRAEPHRDRLLDRPGCDARPGHRLVRAPVGDRALGPVAAQQLDLLVLLIDSQNTGRTDVMLLAIILLAVLGKLSDALLALGEDRLLAARR